MIKKLLIVILVFSQVASALEESFVCAKSFENAQILDLVEARYENIKSLSAKFKQESSFLGFAEKSESEGEVYFKKPGQMDWQYSTPEIQRFVSNGKTLWFYQPDLEQVTLSTFKESFSSELPVSFLLGIGSLHKTFTFKKSCLTAEGKILLELLPKTEDQSVQEFSLLVSSSDYLPQGAKIVDAGGNQTSIIMDKLVQNADLGNLDFNFEIPRGVDVIDQRG